MFRRIDNFRDAVVPEAGVDRGVGHGGAAVLIARRVLSSELPATSRLPPDPC
jgi:hypothetical protein